MFEYLYNTILESYLLSFLLLFTLLHVINTKVFKPLTKLKEGVSYDLEYALKRERSIFSEYTFPVLFFYAFASPINALSNSHYWIYISAATILMSVLFLSDLTFVGKKNNANEGLIAYIAIPMFYIPAIIISIILYLLDIGTG